MTEKYQQRQMYQQLQMYPLAPSSVMPRSDAEESGSYESMEFKKKQRKKCLAYIALFAVFQTIVILVFAVVVMRVKSPKVRLNDITVTNNTKGKIMLTAEIRVKNNNFGKYRFDSSIANVTSRGVSVGQFVIPDGRVRMRSTKKLDVIVEVTNSSGSNSGVLELAFQAKLRGKVEFMKVLKRKKSAEMECSMSINFSTNTVQDLRCK